MTPQAIPVRILIVDDDAMSREVLSVLLEGEGYAVECAESGDAALAMLGGDGDAPEVVLADMQMPGTAGARLGEELRRACGPATLLLAMSASRPSGEALSLFDGFLMKPFTMGEFTAALSGGCQPVSIMASVSLEASGGGREGALHEPRGAGSPSADKDRGRSVLNPAIYDKLSSSMSAPQLRELYAMCIKDVRERIGAMRTLVASSDGERFVREAHSIKGGCGMLGATDLYGMAADLEIGGLQTAGLGGAQENNPLDELAAACDRLERILESNV